MLHRKGAAVRAALALVVFAFLAAACSDAGQTVTARRESPGSAAAPAPEAGGAPATTAAVDPDLPAAPASGGFSCPAPPARAKPRDDRPRYRMNVDVRLAENVVLGDLNVRFTPDLDTDRIVFRLWPNGPRGQTKGAKLEVGAATIDGKAASGALESPTVLTLRRDAPFKAGRAVDVALTWRLTLPAAGSQDRIAREGDAVRLGSFFPILPWENGVGWATLPPTPGFAEASLAPTADFVVKITVPDGLTAMASGVMEQPGTWRADAVRDFAISVGQFKVQAGTVDLAGRPVQVAVGVHAGIPETPEAYMNTVVRSMQDFSDRYGVYPWPSFTLAITPALGGGIEYPMHVMQGPGTQGSVTAHEVAHMWFYGLVGNDQGRDPWLDEGLTTWAEQQFVGSRRGGRLGTRGFPDVGKPMAFFDAKKNDVNYFVTVYNGGALAVGSLGTSVQVDCILRHYVAQKAFAVARPADLIRVATTFVPDASARLAKFGVSG